MRTVVVLAALAVIGLGCDDDGIEGSCSDFCSEIGSCFGVQVTGDQLAECESECVAGFNELPAECESVVGEVLDCTADALCSGENFDIEACGNIEVPASCEEAFDTSAGSCCEADDPCDWANDGFCDCNGDFAWDDADCGGT